MKERRKPERRTHPFEVDQQKFSTQRTVTYCLLAMFTGVAANVFIFNDQSERSMIIQTVINFSAMAVGYWLGASKQGQDQAQAMSRMAEGSPQPKFPKDLLKETPVDNMNVKAENVNVEQPKT